MATPLITAIRERDQEALHELLAPDVRFNSPVRSYDERDQIVHLLTTIGGVLEELDVRRKLEGPGETVSFVAGGRLDGVLDERYDAHGRVTELTLILRPLAELREAVKAMGQALGG